MMRDATSRLNMRNASASLSRAQKSDDNKWDAATSYVAAWTDWKKTLAKFGSLSKEEREAWDKLKRTERRFKRINRRRNVRSTVSMA